MTTLELLRASKARLASLDGFETTSEARPLRTNELNELSPPPRPREPGDDDDRETDPEWLAEFNRLIGRPDA